MQKNGSAQWAEAQSNSDMVYGKKCHRNGQKIVTLQEKSRDSSREIKFCFMCLVKLQEGQHSAKSSKGVPVDCWSIEKINSI